MPICHYPIVPHMIHIGIHIVSPLFGKTRPFEIAPTSYPHIDSRVVPSIGDKSMDVNISQMWYNDNVQQPYESKKGDRK
jgi:hypothetical protein